MTLFIILTIIQALVAAALVGVVLMQRSEGGGLGIGGSPGGALGARGAADFLTRSTRWLAIAFVVLSIVLAALAVAEARVDDVSSTLDRDAAAPSAPNLLGEDSSAPDGGAAAASDLLGEPAEPAESTAPDAAASADETPSQ